MKKCYAVIIFLVLTLGSCDSDTPEPSTSRYGDITGIWMGFYGPGNRGTIKLELNSVNTNPGSIAIWRENWNLTLTAPDGTIDIYNGSWARSGGALVLKHGSYDHHVTLSGNKMAFSLASNFILPIGSSRNYELTKGNGGSVQIDNATLRLKNESSVTISNARFNNSFTNNQQVEAGTNIIIYAEAGSGYIYFDIGSTNTHTALRTQSLMVIEKNEQAEFTLTNNTAVVEVNNPNTIKTLGEYIK